MGRDYVIQIIARLLAELKVCGMTDEAYFDVVIDLELALEKARENGGE